MSDIKSAKQASQIQGLPHVAGRPTVRPNTGKFKNLKFSTDHTVRIFTEFNEGTLLS